MKDDEQICPDCAEIIKLAAKVCKHCGFRFPMEAAREAQIGSHDDAVQNATDLEIHKCPACLKPTPQKTGVCRHCGSNFGGSTASLADRTIDGGGKGVAIGCGLVCTIIFLGLAFLLNQCSDARKAEEAREKVEAAQAAKAAAAEEAEEKRKGFHCLSSWDGSHRQVVEAVKQRLRDPDSFEHVETMILPVNASGKHGLIMKYRARNGFGGLNVGQAAAIVDNKTCNATLQAIDD